MEYPSSRPGSPGGSGTATPLQELSHNQQRDSSSLFTSLRRVQQEDARDSSVHDKINQFNSLAMQSKQLERKTADAALKRAMLGREEAESEMRRYREEARQLRKQVDEGKERERRVGERLETVMENYGRAKETHTHTQALWEKEIRRARKETFKAQSALVKHQEELKSCRAAQKLAEEELEREKERSKAREQEAFTARYSLVGLQEQLDQALERVKMLEQERDAFKTLAKNEDDVARIAAEGKLPLPESSEDETDASPSHNSRARVSSVTLVDVKTSASSEAELDELTRLWQWEKQRADRALELVDFLEAECQLRFCPGAKAARSGRTSISSLHRKRGSIFKIADAGDLVILSEKAIPASPSTRETSPKRSKTEMLREEQGLRRSTVFVPAEGIFRTVSSQAEAESLNRGVEQRTISPTSEPSPKMTPSKASEPPTPADRMPRLFARTPSVEPPDFAISAQQRTSLLSLLDAPHDPEPALQGFHVPTTPGPMALSPEPVRESTSEGDTSEVVVEQSGLDTPTQTAFTEPIALAPPAPAQVEEPVIRPHTSATCYTMATTTTRVPLREENNDPSLAQRIMKLQRTPSRAGEPPSFDVNNAALTPTMTREQALAAIRERRGRARSVGKIVPPVVTPKRPLADKENNRNVSAPTGRVGGPLGVTPGRRVRS
ncbi:hypothetical protein OQA88_11211 [Cercophora sp. LCS_1]